MKHLILVIGPPAAGKTTMIKAICQINPDYRIVSSDEFWMRDPETGKRLWYDDAGLLRSWGTEIIPDHILANIYKLANQLFKVYLSEGHNVILEGTFPKPKDRKIVLKDAKKHDYQVDCHYSFPSLFTCVSRNDERFDCVPDKILARTYGAFIPPTYQEGFNKIIVYDNGDG